MHDVSAALLPLLPCCPAPPAEASRKLLEVVALLRKRPSIQETGLLWQLQASLHETAEEQERLKGWVGGLLRGWGDGGDEGGRERERERQRERERERERERAASAVSSALPVAGRCGKR